MALKFGITRSALAELNPRVQRYGELFRANLKAWLHDLAEEAESGEHESSHDALDFLRNLGEKINSMTGLERWRQQSIITKAHTAFTWMLTRRPPWEFRMATKQFMVSDSQGVYHESLATVTIVYEIDRTKNRLAVTRFIHLPPA